MKIDEVFTQLIKSEEFLDSIAHIPSDEYYSEIHYESVDRVLFLVTGKTQRYPLITVHSFDINKNNQMRHQKWDYCFQRNDKGIDWSMITLQYKHYIDKSDAPSTKELFDKEPNDMLMLEDPS